MAFAETMFMAVANAMPRGVERLIRAVAANDALLAWTQSVTARTLRGVRNPGRIAVVSDTNIGDAVVLQGACAAFKRWLPSCQIDYFYQQKASPLLRANPFIDRHHPVFTDADFTSTANRQAVQSSIRDREYDLVLNLYPFLMNSELAGAQCPILVPYRLITGIIRAERDPAAKAHVAHHLRLYVDRVARTLAVLEDTPFESEDHIENILYLPEDVPARAAEVLRAAGIEPDASIAFLNPDSSSRFSRIPVPMQAELLRALLALPHFDRVLLGPAYSFVGIPDELCGQVAGHPGFSKLVRLPQDIPIDAYAGLIDRADLFITADTAQMHIAAARRVIPSRSGGFRNRTALLSVFGATHSRVYGYDSFSSGYLDSSQDAPAKVFEGTPPCRNLTCIHKTRKNCRTVECFTGLNPDQIIGWIQQWKTSPSGWEIQPDSVLSVSASGTFPESRAGTDKPEPVIVVSGLPRSGTSLMMQMLEAGGVEIATDGVRCSDADNPRGYYELERVKDLDRDASWLSECRGKAVKIVSMLLGALPGQNEYRIIFMERRMSEILASQRKMLERKGRVDSGESDSEIASSYRRHLALLKQSVASRTDIQMLYLPHHSVIQSPLEIAARIQEFLQRDLDLERMAHVVDPKLHRQHSPPLGSDLRI